MLDCFDDKIKKWQYFYFFFFCFVQNPNSTNTEAMSWTSTLPSGLRVLTLNSPSNHTLAVGMSNGSTAVYSTAPPMSALCLCKRKHANPVAAVTFSTPPPPANSAIILAAHTRQAGRGEKSINK